MTWFYRYRPNTSDLVEALRQIGAPAIPYLARALRQRDGLLQKAYWQAYPRLFSMFGNRIPLPPPYAVNVRRAAAEALCRMTEVARPAFPALLAAAEDQDDRVRACAIDALSKLSDQFPEIQSVLSARIKAGTPSTEVFQIVRQYHLRDARTAQIIAVALKDDDIQVHGQALALLQRMGPPAGAALPAVLEMLKDPRKAVRCRALQALARIRSTNRNTLDHLAQALLDNDEEVRYDAVRAFEGIGVAPLSILPALTQMTNDPSPMVRSAAARTLKVIGARP